MENERFSKRIVMGGNVSLDFEETVSISQGPEMFTIALFGSIRKKIDSIKMTDEFFKERIFFGLEISIKGQW